jgi:hypothetical protein
MKHILLMIAVVALVGGCGTPFQTPMEKTWNSRVDSGSYTRNDAILDLGPPTTGLTLYDGRVVDVWKTGLAPSQFGTTGTNLQLTFSKTEKGLVLTSWNYRRW